MNSSIWGKHAWHFLHIISFDYPNNPTQSIREKYYNFFDALSEVLPCGICRDNYKKKLQNLNLLGSLNCKQDLINFVINLHNNVSRDLGKKEYKKEDVIKYYQNLYKIDKTDNTKYCEGQSVEYNNNILYILIIILLIIITYFIIKKNKL
jgi:hypothetical protein